MDRKIKIFQDISEMDQFAAKKVVTISKRLIKKTGRFTFALCGGNTPKSFYHLLTTDEFRNEIDWENVYFFLGDERDVSPMSDQSNFRMINEILFQPLDIPKTNIIRWPTEIINAEEVALNYQRALVKALELGQNEFPKFDLVLLGMGEDGHTASLFPKSKALTEEARMVVANYVEKYDSQRLTFTYPTINNSSNILFLIAGEEKAAALKEVLEGEQNITKYPAQGVNINSGTYFWLVDEKAGELLSK